MADEGSFTFDFVWQSDCVQTRISCCDNPSPLVGERVDRPPDTEDTEENERGQTLVGGLMLAEGDRAWWLGCHNCGRDIVAIVWNDGLDPSERATASGQSGANPDSQQRPLRPDGATSATGLESRQ